MLAVRRGWGASLWIARSLAVTGIVLLQGVCSAFVPATHTALSARTRAALSSAHPSLCSLARPARKGLTGLRLSAEGGTESLSKEEEKDAKRKKYEGLYKELLLKASKLPPGPSKTSYITKARNAKAMADALAYKKPDEAAEEPADKKDEGKEEPKKEEKPRKPPMEIDIIPASRYLLDELTDIVNYAYRGKGGKEGWTGEMKYLEGIRIAKEDMEKVLEQAEDDDNLLRVLVAVSTSGPAVGCIKVEPTGKGEAELGMFGVDPDAQSSGVGTKLLAEAEKYARNKLEAEKVSMFVLDVREDLLAWYFKKGYKRTGEYFPFPTDANVGTPKRELRFEKLEKTEW